MIKFLLSNDKLLHLLSTYAIVKTSKYLGFLPIGIGVAIILSIAKELYDKYIQHEKFDIEDIYADTLGIILATI